MLELLISAGEPRAERVFLAKTKDGHLVEWAETWSPPHQPASAWMISVSPSLGCPVGCAFCDAGKFYKGKLDAAEILAQIDHALGAPAEGIDPHKQLWIEFSKVGEPSFNSAVLEVLRALPQRYGAGKLAPIVSTVAPNRTDPFFEELSSVRRLFGPGEFQLRFSLHSSDEAARRKLIPIKSWSFERIADYGQRFHRPQDRKVALRFAVSPSFPLSVRQLVPLFSPEIFSVELTPLNATDTTAANGFTSTVHLPANLEVAEEFRRAGFEVAVCLSNPAADELRASCGMSVAARLDTPLPPRRWRDTSREG